MKSLLISAMVMLSATTASAFDYVVTGNAAPEMEGKMFYLLDDNSNLVDSTKVTAGKFKFQGNADKAYYGRIGFKENVEGGVRTNYIAELIVEPGTVEMDMNKRMPAKGGELNTKFASLWGGVMAKQNAVMKQLEALQKDSLDQETMMQKRNEIVNAFRTSALRLRMQYWRTRTMLWEFRHCVNIHSCVLPRSGRKCMR